MLKYKLGYQADTNSFRIGVVASVITLLAIAQITAITPIYNTTFFATVIVTAFVGCSIFFSLNNERLHQPSWLRVDEQGLIDIDANNIEASIRFAILASSRVTPWFIFLNLSATAGASECRYVLWRTGMSDADFRTLARLVHRNIKQSQVKLTT